MPDTRFDVVVERAGDASVLRLHGDIDRHAQEALDRAADGTGQDAIVLDFRDVGYINSTGIAVIVGLLARARAGGRQIRAYGLTSHYRQIFQITRISDFIGIYEDEAAAVAAG